MVAASASAWARARSLAFSGRSAVCSSRRLLMMSWRRRIGRARGCAGGSRGGTGRPSRQGPGPARRQPPTPGALPRSPSYGGCPEGRGPWSPYPHRLRRCFGCGAASGVAPRAPTAPSQLSDGRPAREPMSGTCPSSWSERTRSTLARTPDGRARGAVQCSARPAALPTRSGRRYEDPLVASWPCAAGGLDLPCAAAILLGARSAPSMPDERAGRGLGHSGHRGSWTGLMAVSLAVAVRRAGQCAVRQ